MFAPFPPPYRPLRWLLLFGVSLLLSLGCHYGFSLTSARAILLSEGGGAIASAIPPAIAPVDLPDPISPHVLVQSAQILYEQQRYMEASQQLGQAADIYEEWGDRASQAQALGLQSLALQKLGDWSQAQALLDQSFTSLAAIAQPPARIRAQVFNAQGHLYLATGQSQAALISWENAEQDYRSVEELNGALGSQINQVQALESLGAYRQAAEILNDIETDWQQISDSTIKVKGLLALANMLRLQGELQRSQTQLNAGLALAQSLNLPQLLSQIYLGLGNTEHILMVRAIALDTPTKAEPHRQAALEFYQQAVLTAPSSLNRIEAQLSQLRLLTQAQPSRQRGLVPLDLPPDIQLLIRDIQQTLPQLPPSRRVIYAQINLAQSLMQWIKLAHASPQVSMSRPHLEVYTEAIAPLLERAIAQGERLTDERAIAYGMGTLGTWYEHQHHWSFAKTLTQTALQKAQAIQADDIAYQWQWQMGRIIQAEADDEADDNVDDNVDQCFSSSKNLGSSEVALRLSERHCAIAPAQHTAIAYYSAAVNTLNALRTNLVALNPDIQFSFREQVEPIYRQLVDLLLREPNPSQSQLRQARDVIESLQLAELDNFFRDTCAQPQAVNIGTVDPTAAVVYPILLGDMVTNSLNSGVDSPIRQRLAVIVQLPPTVTATQDSAAIAPATDESRLLHVTQWVEADIPDAVAQLQGSLKLLRTPISEIKAQAQPLYNWLIRPFEAELDRHTDRENSPIKTLVFVLDGPLRNLPMAVLHDGEQYLVERYAIATTPGLQLLDPHPLQRQPLNILLGGTENAPSFTSIGLGPLANVNQELDRIGDTVVSHQSLKDEAFLQQNIQQQLAAIPFNVVHLATHGNFSSDPEQTFILDWQGAITVPEIDRVLRVGDPQRMINDPVELLVLSACETAVGDRRAALGLAGIAIRAGARSTLATLWQINDASTTEFMVRFYQALTHPDVTKADALRHVQLSFLRDNPRTQYHRPNRWAAFTLVGNWL